MGRSDCGHGYEPSAFGIVLQFYRRGKTEPVAIGACTGGDKAPAPGAAGSLPGGDGAAAGGDEPAPGATSTPGYGPPPLRGGVFFSGVRDRFGPTDAIALACEDGGIRVRSAVLRHVVTTCRPPIISRVAWQSWDPSRHTFRASIVNTPRAWLLNQFLERVKSAANCVGAVGCTRPTIAPALLGEIKSQIEPKKASVRLAGGSMI